MAHRNPPLRIGVWCDYGFTLTPTAGIGVFVYNLVAGLLELENEDIEIVMLVRPGDQHLIDTLRKKSPTRLSTIPRPEVVVMPNTFARIADGWLQVTDRCRLVKEAAKRRFLLAIKKARRTADGFLGRWRPWMRRSHFLLVTSSLVGVVLTPLIFFASWLAYGLYRITVASLRALTFPQRVLDRMARSLMSHAESQRIAREWNHDPLALVRAAACDVWLIPYYGLRQPLSFPSVLVIHDLVYLRFPESVPSDHRAELSVVVPKRASEATLCACMSQSTRDNDLLGALGLPRNRVRTITHAPPTDFCEVTEEEADNELKALSLPRPYLFFPAEFRPYKNHRLLIEALQILLRRGEHWLDVVFTGGNGAVPEEIRTLVEKYDLQERVRILGRVDRSTLAALYKRAFATIVPSLYEQGSFPLYEALRHGCPAACSRIPSLLEQCSSMGDAMLYFDPLDPGSLADTVRIIANDREGIRRRQTDSARLVWGRTWKDAAREWLAVFREATQLSGTPWSHGIPEVVSEPLKAFLFLPVAYQGGVSEFLERTLKDLAALNRKRGRLRLTIGIPQDGKLSRPLDSLDDSILIEKIGLGKASEEQLAEVFGSCNVSLASAQRFSFFETGAAAAKEADAWVALADRFTRPLLPMRPYGVMVYDVIQSHVPEAFEALFFKYWEEGILPSLRSASILVINPEVIRDLSRYGINPSVVRQLPLTWDCEARFGRCLPRHVDISDDRFLLNVTNASIHKGAKLLLNGYARMKRSGVDRVPPLVICGSNTEAFSRRFDRTPDHPHWAAMRKLVSDLDLQEDRDIYFLGYVTDSELKDLYQRCSVVVNAAKYDMGSFSLIEAAYFGKHAVSARYPGVEYLVRRFNIPITFFPMDDSGALADALGNALVRPQVDPGTLMEVRKSLASPEFSTVRFAEGLYDLTVALCERGRIEKMRSMRSRSPITVAQA